MHRFRHSRQVGQDCRAHHGLLGGMARSCPLPACLPWSARRSSTSRCLRDQLARHVGETVRSLLETERILLAAVLVGQHVFARRVLANCGGQCVSCVLRPAALGARRMLLSGHVKP
jgi:hypothetical protein